MIGLEKFSGPKGSVLANAIRSKFRGWEGSLNSGYGPLALLCHRKQLGCIP